MMLIMTIAVVGHTQNTKYRTIEHNIGGKRSYIVAFSSSSTSNMCMEVQSTSVSSTYVYHESARNKSASI